MKGEQLGVLEVIPPLEHQDKQHHWLVSERASHPSISEWIKGEWHGAGEVYPISPEEMYRRGWRYGCPAVPPKSIHDDGEDTPETVTAENEGADVGRITDQIKDALQDQKRLQERVHQETEKLRQSRLALTEADHKVSKLVKQLLEETLGSVYDARVVLYHLTGKRT